MKVEAAPDSTKFLVIGSGLAGLAFALKVADLGPVLVLAKNKLGAANTTMAQGGIAAVMSPDDSFDRHVEDTLIAGAGLCHRDVVEQVVAEAPDRIRDLIAWGVKFDVKDHAGNELDLTREGGHSRRRILHVQDHTGAEIHRELLARALAHKNIQFVEDCVAIDLIIDGSNPTGRKCIGAQVLMRTQKKIQNIFAPVTLLATGGAGKVYLYTSNWEGATGDGIAMAYRAGAEVRNLEFMQFHPTCLYHPHARNFLITEALRGEGGILLNKAGERFTLKVHASAELAPRDIVARAIDAEMKRTGADHVYLDISHKPAEEIRERFPHVYENCLKFGVDITKQPIPVVPAAHYLCGGVFTSTSGETNIAGLFVAGESACTGLHGANRLASNSLLECLVVAHNAAEKVRGNDLLRNLGNTANARVPDLKPLAQNTASSSEDELIVISHSWEEIRRLMWNYVGIVRSDRRLERAERRMDVIQNDVQQFWSELPLTSDLIELRNLSTVAALTVKCARERRESRGIHFNIDYPETRTEFLHDTIA